MNRLVHREWAHFVFATHVLSPAPASIVRMSRMHRMETAASPRAHPLVAGLRVSWRTLLLIAAINTGIALVLWIDDIRPFWHPLLTVQLYGFAIAYCVNVAAPWDHDKPLRRLAVASLIGALIGVVLVIVVKGYPLAYVRERWGFFFYNVFVAFGNGLLISLIFYVKRREARAAAALHKAEADRHLLSKQAVEAELKLLQAQVEPHFLFNTLASVQYLIDTDPKEANVLLGHLIGYLRAALPQLRASSSTLAREIALAEAYLNILRMRIGPRLTFAIDVPEELRGHPFPPNLLISLVENAIKHGVEPSADGGSIRIAAEHRGDDVVVTVTDTGRGLSPAGRTDGQGVGLTNLRERLAALYGSRGGFTLEPATPRGVRATLSLPFQATVAA
jgi:sensor histidine kinase YesM